MSTSDRVINIFEQLRDAAEDECVGDILYLWRLGRGVIRHNGILYERDDYGPQHPSQDHGHV